MFWKKYEKVVFISILLVSVFLRFYKTQEFFVFSLDEEHQMSLAYSIVKNFHIEWIGTSMADTGFYLGPLWIYFEALWLYLSSGDPAIGAYIASSIGVLTTIVLYFITEKLFGVVPAQITSLLYSVLPLFVYYDKRFWNPSFIPLVSILLLYWFYLSKASKYYWILIFALYGLVFHLHLSLAPLGLLILFLFIKDFRKTNLKIKILSLISFILMISPILIFDIFSKG